MLCCFDFDGTLADSRQAHYKGVRKYADQQSFPMPSQEEMDLVFGNPNPPLVFKGWGTHEEFKQHLMNVYFLTDDIICEDPSCMPLFEGVNPMLSEIEGAGIRSCIVTSRSLTPLMTVMNHHKISGFFKTIRSHQDVIDRGYRGKPHPDKLHCVLNEMKGRAERAVMVGDTLMEYRWQKTQK